MTNRRTGNILTTESLDSLSVEQGATVTNFKMAKNKALTCITGSNSYAIAIDRRRVQNESERRSLIAHELGHCATGSFYSADNFTDCASRHEYRANMWAIKKLMPKRKLSAVIRMGHREVWELAEYFEVTEELVRFALWAYYDITPTR